MIEDVCQRQVIGNDPFQIERLWRIIYSSGYSQRPDVSLVGVLSAIEMACWDIIGKELGKPVYELLGGRVHETLRSYTYLYPHEGDTSDVYSDPELAARRAAEYVQQGFNAVKFDQTPGAGRPAMAGRAGTAGKPGSHGAGCARYQYSYRQRRAAHDQIRIRAPAGLRRGVDHPASARSGWRPVRSQKNRRHGRSALRANRAALVLRSDLWRGRRAA